MTAVLDHKRWLVWLAFMLCFLPLCRAQQTQEQLAAHYYSSGQFEQAAESYEALYARAPNKFYYQMLFRSYLELKEYKEAIRLAEKRIKQYPNDLYLYVDMGRAYELRGDRRKANKTYDSAVQKIGFDTKQISELTQAFETAGHPEHAIQVYLLARKKMRNDLAYVSELATLYQHVGNYEAMMQEYFDLLDKSPNMLGSIQISLQRVLNETANPKLVDGLRSTLVQRVQQSPDNKSYIEMMLWFSLQQKDFQFALVQAKAVDARFPDMGGEPLMRVASIARSNQAYDVAQECYRLVAQKGSDSPNYFPARVGGLEVAFERLNRNFPIENKLLTQLLHDYQSALDELGKNLRTVQLMRNYADLLAYYADSVQPAADLLYDVLDLPKLPAKERDETKLALADLLLFVGEVWDASLLYMQVEKANKNDVLGSLAKFKNAKLSYYNNDFLWAKTQLNVLRASTSKLIANDAMELSLLISDNMEEDSTFDMLSRYAAADLLLYRNLLDSAWDAFDDIAHSTLSHPLFDEVLYQKARIRIRQQRYADADTLLQQLIDFYPNDLLADDALLLLAQLNEERLSNPLRARSCYEKLILDYPSSLYVDQARKRYRALSDALPSASIQ
ncbi:MAG: tetratricopeptide repeat protein [Bacteroidales bacterium]|nr:tetratricopeptide repeat protein [Bacteroidales bacterium]